MPSLLISLPQKKEDDLSDCANWRGVTLPSMLCNVLCSIWLNRMKQTVDEIPRDEQSGFPPYHSGTDVIFALRKYYVGNIKFLWNTWTIHQTIQIHIHSYEMFINLGQDIYYKHRFEARMHPLAFFVYLCETSFSVNKIKWAVVFPLKKEKYLIRILQMILCSWIRQTYACRCFFGEFLFMNDHVSKLCQFLH